MTRADRAPGTYVDFKIELRAAELQEVARLAEAARHQGWLTFRWGPWLRFAWADVRLDKLPQWMTGRHARALRTAELAYRARRPRRIPRRIGTYPVPAFVPVWRRR